MKRAKRTLVILSLALASCRAPVYAPTATPQTFSVQFLATTATAPLLEDLAHAYTHPGVLLAVRSITADWQTVYDRLLAGDAPYALTAYLPAGTALWAAPIGTDGIAVIVHADNPVPALALADLGRIFQGRITNWSEVGGPDLPIQVVSREDGSDTRLAFQQAVMGDYRTTQTARLALSSQSMVEIVASEPGAVGYVSMAFLDSRVRAVPVGAGADDSPVLPTPDSVSDGRYPLRAPILVVGLQPPAEDSFYRDWFAWMQSEGGQSIIRQRYGGMPPH